MTAQEEKPGDGSAAADDGTSVGRLGRDTIIYGVGFVLQRAASLIMLPIFTQYLTPGEYGILELLQMSLDVASIMLAAGITAAVWRYYFKYEDARERRAVVGGAWLMMLAFNAIGAAILVGAAEPLAALMLDDAALDGLVVITAFSFLLDPCLTLPTLLMQVEQRARLYTLTSVARLTIQITLNVVFLVFLDMGVRGVVISTLITYGVLAPVVMTWFFRRVGFVWIGHVSSRVFWFGLPYRLTEAGTFILTFVDRYFLKAMQGLAVTGVYSLAYKFGFLLAYLGQVPFLMAWNPQRFKMVKAPREERDRFYRRGLLLFSALVLSLGVGISLFARPALEIMSDPEYYGAADLVPLIVLAYVFQAWTMVLEFGIQVSERTSFVTWGTWIAVATILGLYWLLIPEYGAAGAAVATAVAFAVRLVAFHVFSQRLWPIDYGWARPLRMLLLATGVVVAGVLLRPAGVALQIAQAAALSVGWFALLWWAGLDPAARRAARDGATKVRTIGARLLSTRAN